MPSVRRITVGEVFVPGGLPTITYNPRIQHGLEQQLRDYLDERRKILSISGATKTGKTVLVRSVLDDSDVIWVSGGTVSNSADLWEVIADDLGIDTELEQARQSADGRSRSYGGELSAGMLKGTKSTEMSSADSRSSRVQRTRPVQAAARKALLESMRPLVIDDFHYISPDVQLEIVRGLKDLVFLGSPIIVIAVPHRAYDVVRIEKEMNGRVQHLPVEFWSNDELLGIAEKAFLST